MLTRNAGCFGCNNVMALAQNTVVREFKPSITDWTIVALNKSTPNMGMACSITSRRGSA